MKDGAGQTEEPGSKLQAALKTSLDELRMQMLGAQVLFGFQFQGLFQDNFDSLPAPGRAVAALSLGLMIAVIGLILAVPSQHRLVERGEDTPRILRISGRYANRALLPLAGAISGDLFIAAGAQFDAGLSALLAVITLLVAIAAWYVVGRTLRRRHHHRGDPPMKEHGTALHAKIEQMLTESRVILPGAQALLGFQLVVMMTKAFDHLPQGAKLVHLAALLSLVLAIILLISPAAIHRLAFQGRDDPGLHAIGSLIITVALLPLASAISLDLGVALFKLFGGGALPAAGAVVAALFLIGLWYVLPLMVRRRVLEPPP